MTKVSKTVIQLFSV